VRREGPDGIQAASPEAELASTRLARRKYTLTRSNFHDAFHSRQRHLQAETGIGDTTAAKMLDEIMDVKLYESARQLAAFAGLVPRLHESGSSVRRKARLSKTGAPRLRKALYFSAIVALRYHPHARAMSERLKKRGKCAMQLIGAAMRKLFHLAYGVLKLASPLILS
jgi:transposase